MGGEVVKFPRLKMEGFRTQVELDLAFGFLPEKAEQFAQVKGNHVTDDRGVLRQFGDLPGIGDGVL